MQPYGIVMFFLADWTQSILVEATWDLTLAVTTQTFELTHHRNTTMKVEAEFTSSYHPIKIIL